MKKNLNDFTTFELIQELERCTSQICNMTANKEIIEYYAVIEQELARRKEDGNS